MTWLLTRSAGVGAYLMLYLSVAWGLLATTSLVTKRVSKRSSTAFHGFVASAGLMLVALHLVGLLFDRFVRFDALDLLIPYRATYRPFALTLGIAGLYAMVSRGMGPWGFVAGFFGVYLVLQIVEFSYVIAASKSAAGGDK